MLTVITSQKYAHMGVQLAPDVMVNKAKQVWQCPSECTGSDVDAATLTQQHHSLVL